MKHFAILLALFLSASVLAQKDPDAKLYLDKISNDLNIDKALFINFDYIMEDQQNQTEVRGSGELVLMQEKYKVGFDEAVVFFDGEKLYSFNKEIEEVYISIPDPDNAEFMFSDPISLLKKYDEAFKYRLVGPGTIEGISATEVQLYPEDLDNDYALLKLYFAGSDDTLKGIVARKKDGVIYTMIVTEMTVKEDPGIEFFRFDQEQYPNVDVIELID
ncbi:outer membrane lipoprotein carrier protein LolA [Bacteroidota bacterium]